MRAVTLKEAQLNLERIVEQVIADAEPAIVVTESGKQVVLLPLDEYNSWKENEFTEKVDLLSLQGTLKSSIKGVTLEDMKEATRKEAASS